MVCAEQKKPTHIATGKVLDWSFTYGAESGVWICTELAWYVAMLIAANSAFQQLSWPNVWTSRAWTLSVKCSPVKALPCQFCCDLERAVVKQYLGPLDVLQMNCLRRICGIFLGNHVPSVDILNRCITAFVDSQLQSKRLR